MFWEKKLNCLCRSLKEIENKRNAAAAEEPQPRSTKRSHAKVDDTSHDSIFYFFYVKIYLIISIEYLIILPILHLFFINTLPPITLTYVIFTIHLRFTIHCILRDFKLFHLPNFKARYTFPFYFTLLLYYKLAFALLIVLIR